MSTKQQQKEQAEYQDKLRAIIKPGDTLYTTVKHVSSSGMLRVIDVFLIKNNQPTSISSWVAFATGNKWDRDRGGVRMSGAGMDMGFETVYNLSYTLWPKGYACTGEGCHSNDHSNGDRVYTPHQHNDGGYALHQRWL